MTSLKLENIVSNQMKWKVFYDFATELFEWINDNTELLYLEPGRNSLCCTANQSGIIKPPKNIQAVCQLKTNLDELILEEMLTEFKAIYINAAGPDGANLPAYTPHFAEKDTYQININKNCAYRSTRINEKSGWVQFSQVSGKAETEEDLRDIDQQAIDVAQKLLEAGYKTKCHSAYRAGNSAGYAIIDIAAEDLIRVNDCSYVQMRELSGIQYISQQLRHQKETLRGKLGVMIIRHNQKTVVYESIPRPRRSDALSGRAGQNSLINFPIQTYAQFYRRFNQ